MVWFNISFFFWKGKNPSFDQKLFFIFAHLEAAASCLHAARCFREMLLKGEDNFWSDKCCFAQKRPFLGMGWEEEIMWRVKKSFAYNFSKRDLSKVPESTLMYLILILWMQLLITPWKEASFKRRRRKKAMKRMKF